MNRNYHGRVLAPLLAVLLLVAVAVPKANAADTNGTTAGSDNTTDSSNTTIARLLRQVHVITRHGSRLPLEKQPDSLAELSPGTLTAVGERQHYDLGVWLKQRYRDDSSNDKSYFSTNLDDVSLESSDTARTVVSANALTVGLFDAAARDPHNETKLAGAALLRPNLPIYTTAAVNDVTIRAYDKCPTFLHRLQALYAGAEYRALESTYETLLTKLATYTVFDRYRNTTTNRIALKEIVNVYDLVQVAKTECAAGVSESACLDNPQAQDVLTDAEWGQLQALTRATENLKYGVASAESLLGGPLLQRIVGRMMNSTAAPSTSKGDSYAKFFLYSAHYPTILGVLSALAEAPPTNETVPPYASALIFELYDPDPAAGGGGGVDELVVDIYYKSGDRETAVRLGRSCPQQHCPLLNLSALVVDTIDAKNWCRDCGNDSADVCLRQIVQQLQANANGTTTTANATNGGASSTSGQSSPCTAPAATVGGVFGGVAAGFLLALVLSAWRRGHRQSKRSHTAAAAAAGVEDDDVDDGAPDVF